MSKLKEKELFTTLDLWRLKTQERTAHIWHPKDEQAFQQIKERIQAYTEHQELETRYIDIVIDLYDQLEQKKPEVDEGFINTWANEFATATLHDKEMHRKIVYMLKEAGVRLM